MTLRKSSSLQVRLAVRLAALYIIATALAVAALLFQAYSTAGSLNDRELSLRAEDLAKAVVSDGSGKPHLNLPLRLAAAYAAPDVGGMFAIRDTSGHIIAASPAKFGESVSKWPPATDEASYFRLSDYESKNYNG
jgi:hypothetical protein